MQVGLVDGDNVGAGTGYATLRFTYRQVVDETLLVAVRIAQVLALCDRAHSALDR